MIEGESFTNTSHGNHGNTIMFQDVSPAISEPSEEQQDQPTEESVVEEPLKEEESAVSQQRESTKQRNNNQGELSHNGLPSRTVSQ